MAEEVKDTVETTEAGEATEKKETSKKGDKKKVNIDTDKIKGQAMGALGKLKAFFVEKPDTAKWVVIGGVVVQALLAFGAGMLNFIISVILAAVIAYGTFVSHSGNEDADDSTEEASAE